MATRAKTMLDRAMVASFTAAAYIPAAFTPVKFVTDDDHVTPCDHNDVDMIGWAKYPITSASFTAGHVQCDVVLNGTGIIPVLVADNGTATRGKLAVGQSSSHPGYTNAATLVAGSTLQLIQGRFMQSGVAGDYVGLLIGGVNTFGATT